MSISIHQAGQCPRLPMSALAGALADLLTAADGLVPPCYVTISDTESVDLQFRGEWASFQSITAWALHFGGHVVTVSVRDTKVSPATWIESVFDWHGITVEMYAAVPLDDPEHSDYPHEPGRLHDCPACMAECYCTPDTAECVFDGPHRVPPF